MMLTTWVGHLRDTGKDETGFSRRRENHSLGEYDPGLRKVAGVELSYAIAELTCTPVTYALNDLANSIAVQHREEISYLTLMH